jgi:aminoglycoside phosphotransferase (APT) family kinase protein
MRLPALRRGPARFDAMTEIKGIDAGPVTAWFEANVEGARGPLSFELIAGGHSNLTYGVTDADGHRFVLRRPPLGHVLATAHDMGREHRIIAALGPTDIPVPATLGLCTDDSVNGAPFYVMGFVDGFVLRDQKTAEAELDVAARRRAGESIADTLAALHAVDVEAVGLGDLGKHEGYIARQLKRWYSQFQASNELTKRPVPLMHEVHDRLADRIPEQQGVAVVHGDYRLDNCMVGPDGNVVAVLDWEICTLGDPLADLGLLQVYWTDRTDPEATLLGVAPTLAEGFPTKAELNERYAGRSDRDLSQLDFYTAFGYWKLAAIIEGVYSRYAGGAMGEDASGFEGFANQVVRLAERAAEAADRLG